MKNEQLLRASEADLIAEYENNIAPHVGLAVSSIQLELQRRATIRLVTATSELAAATASLVRSSSALERFTKGRRNNKSRQAIATLPLGARR